MDSLYIVMPAHDVPDAHAAQAERGRQIELGADRARVLEPDLVLPTQAKMINFSRLSTFLMRQHRDKFVEMLGERLNLTPEDLEEGENAAHPNEETSE